MGKSDRNTANSSLVAFVHCSCLIYCTRGTAYNDKIVEFVKIPVSRSSILMCRFLKCCSQVYIYKQNFTILLHVSSIINTSLTTEKSARWAALETVK